MSDVLLKGENIKLLVDGIEFGGVTKVKSVRKNEITEIGTFLSEVPVYVNKESRYEIDMELDVGKDSPFSENKRVSKIEICYGNGRVRYDECIVKDMQTVIKPKGRISSEITLSAKERTVL